MMRAVRLTLLLPLLFLGGLGCDQARQASQVAPAADAPGSKAWAEKEAARINQSFSGIDWAAFVKGYAKKTFYAKDRYSGGFEKYEAYRLTGAKMWAKAGEAYGQEWRVNILGELTFKGPKGQTMSRSDQVEAPRQLDLNRCLYESFWDADPFPRGTSAYFKKLIKEKTLAIGMTGEQVEMILGYPDDTSHSSYSWGTSALWIYRRYGRSTHVFFSDGRVNSVSNL